MTLVNPLTVGTERKDDAKMTLQSNVGMLSALAPRLLVSSLVLAGFLSLIALSGCKSGSDSSNDNGGADANTQDVVNDTAPTEAATDAVSDSVVVDTIHNDVDTQDAEQDVVDAELDAPYDKGIETVVFTSGWVFDRAELEKGQGELNKHPEGVRKEAAFIGNFAQESLLVPPTGQTTAYAMRAVATDGTDHFVVFQGTLETDGRSLKKPAVTLRMKWESFGANEVNVGYGDDAKAVLMFVYPRTDSNPKECVGALAQGKIRFVKAASDQTIPNKVDLEITGSRLEMQVANSVTISESIQKLIDEEKVKVCQ